MQLRKGDLVRNVNCHWVRFHVAKITGQFAYFENGYCFPLISLRLVRRARKAK